MSRTEPRILDFDRIVTEEAARLVAVFDEWAPRTSAGFPRGKYGTDGAFTLFLLPINRLSMFLPCFCAPSRHLALSWLAVAWEVLNPRND